MAAANPPQLGQVVIWELAAVEQTAPQHDAQNRLVLHPRDQRADYREACAADVDRGDAVSSTDTLRVVVRVERNDLSHAVFELDCGRQRHRRTHRLACQRDVFELEPLDELDDRAAERRLGVTRARSDVGPTHAGMSIA